MEIVHPTYELIVLNRWRIKQI